METDDRPAMTNIDGMICKCVHRHDRHHPIKSVNYSAGKCKDCDCYGFVFLSPVADQEEPQAPTVLGQRVSDYALAQIMEEFCTPHTAQYPYAVITMLAHDLRDLRAAKAPADPLHGFEEWFAATKNQYGLDGIPRYFYAKKAWEAARTSPEPNPIEGAKE